jgi:hypothetical protein
MINRYREYEHYNRSPEDETEAFLKRFEAQAELSTRKRYYKRKPYNPLDFDYYSKTAMQTLQAEVEPMVEVNIPQHRFTELVEKERYKRYLEERADYDARIVEMLRQDERVRDRNPTVQKAYQKYLMLLEMAR